MPEIDLTVAPNKIVSGLQLLVADLYSLTALTHNLHWNIQGQNFLEYHKFLNEEYDNRFGEIDDASEQIRKLDNFVKVDLAFFKELAQLPEISAPFEAIAGLKVLLAAYEKYRQDLQNLIDLSGKMNDLATQQLVLDFKMSIDKSIWFLKSILK